MAAHPVPGSITCGISPLKSKVSLALVRKTELRLTGCDSSLNTKGLTLKHLWCSWILTKIGDPIPIIFKEPLVAAVPIFNPGGGGFISMFSSLANFPDIIKGYWTLLPLSIRVVVSTRSSLILILMGTLHFSRPIAAIVNGPEGAGPFMLKN